MVAPSKRRTSTARVRISKSGQITLPAAIREQLGVSHGDQVDIVLEKSGATMIVPVKQLSAREISGQFGRAVPPGELQDALREARHSGMVRQRYTDGLKSNDPD